MSDFLKKFSNDSYQNMKKADFTDDKQENIKKEEYLPPKELEQTKKQSSTTTSIRDDVKKEQKPKKDDNKNTTFKTSNTKNEVYVHDEERIKKRRRNMMIGIACAILIIVLGFFGYRKFNEVTVPQFVKEKTLEDVQTWAAKNKVDLVYTSVFSTEVDEGYVVKQSLKKGTVIQKGSSFEIVLSNGANPEEHIKIPDFMKMKVTEIEDWKQKNKAVNVTIEKVFDDEVEKAKTIRVEYKTEGVDAESYRRKDKINIVSSKGKETYEKDIEMPDFVNKSKPEVESWAKEKEVNIEFIEADSSKIMEGNVISQDIPAKTKIAKKDTVKITISRGRVLYAPDFSGLDETQGQIAATKASVSVNLLYYYSDSVPSSYLISQSIPPGTEIKDQSIALMYSLGKPFVGNYDGEDVYAMVQSINEMNAKGAQLSYELVDVSSSEKKGTIITTNYKSSFVNVGTHIVVSVATGS